MQGDAERVQGSRREGGLDRAGCEGVERRTVPELVRGGEPQQEQSYVQQARALSDQRVHRRAEQRGRGRQTVEDLGRVRRQQEVGGLWQARRRGQVQGGAGDRGRGDVTAEPGCAQDRLEGFEEGV